MKYALSAGILSLSFATYASFPLPSDRPDRRWISNFDKAVQVEVTDTIENAISHCPDTGYCTLLVDQLELDTTVYINRSRTRLLGIAGNVVRWKKNVNASGYFFNITSNVSEVIIDGLNIIGDGIERDPDTFGIGAYGSNISKILVRGNHISGLNGKQNAHAIAFYGIGGSEASAIHQLTIEHNRINDMQTGSSETIAVNGNVRQWEIVGNEIRDINNIGIDAIGGEGTAPTQILEDGRIAPGKYDAARFGFIENNSISDMSTASNAAYGKTESWSAAIYVDGGQSISITGNTIDNAPWSLVVGAENCVSASYISIENNESSNAFYGDVLLGGYAKGEYTQHKSINCDPHTSQDASEGHGSVARLLVRNNALLSEAQRGPGFIGATVLQYRVEKSTVEPPFIKLNP